MAFKVIYKANFTEMARRGGDRRTLQKKKRGYINRSGVEVIPLLVQIRERTPSCVECG